MHLRILGQHGDARGAQLETLAANILVSLGYTDIVKNRISHGGHEIDVEARLSQPGLSEPRVTRLICECKAHSIPIGISDWLKFLGKVFTEATTNSEPVSGLLVALSGINGNVAGHYDTIRKYSKNVEVVSGDSIVNAISKFYNLRPIASVIRQVQESTRRSLTEIDLAYYAREFTHVVTFSDNSYTVIPSNPGIDAELREEIGKLVASDENLGVYFDLDTERDSLARHARLKKIVLTCLLMANGSCRLSDLLKPWDTLTSEGLEMADLAAALDELLEWELVERDGTDGLLLSAIAHRSGERSAHMFRELISGSIVLPSLGLPLYDDLIDDSLLDYVSSLHNVIPFSESERGDLVSLLRWSPTALIGAVTPPNWPGSAKLRPSPGKNPEIDRFSLLVFRQEMIDRFLKDYRHPELREYFFEIRSIREIETKRSLSIKSSKDTLLELDVHDRIGIGKANESLGGGFIHVQLTDYAPQPWEPWGAQPQEDQDNSPTD